ncbi:MAG: rhodanese-like domain-containing protein [Flavobacteriaceae bacterium]|nr:rhodanese-like domain-containing protein [Flavobacteriaceae bacterium]
MFIYTLIISVSGFSQGPLDTYLQQYDYDSRNNMKISNEQITNLIAVDSVILLDIRFKEEQAAWGMNYALKMPLNQLPARFKELPKDKLIVTACPHKDRAIIAMMYLISKGYKVGYLKDGLIGLTEFLRGENAKDFINTINN